jgi:hypothetical protein
MPGANFGRLIIFISPARSCPIAPCRSLARRSGIGQTSTWGPTINRSVTVSEDLL